MTGRARIVVALEVGSKRTFASALDWPGWCRSGRGEAGSLAALEAAAPRYALVVAETGIAWPGSTAFDVIERLPGTATTDFGAPEKVADWERRPLSEAEAVRMAALVSAAWVVFDRVVASAPAELRKGPRGGGRDRDKMAEHVLAAEASYARKLGVRMPQPAYADRPAVMALRAAITEALGRPSDGTPVVERGWPARYMARRVAWHVLDHAWEIEDRSN